MAVAAALQTQPKKPEPARPSGQPGRLLQRKCACGTPLAPLSGECPECKKNKLQAKLAIGSTGDPLERQADQMADHVMSAGDVGRPLASARQISRASQGGAASAATPSASPLVDRVLTRSGQTLDAPTRGFMEARFGYDFGHVRVHSDDEAGESARQVGALAYTVGSNIAFAPGRYQPHTPVGQRLLAHELAHVLQQNGPVLRRAPDPQAVKDFDDRVAEIKKHPAYKKLPAGAKQKITEIVTEARKRDNPVYYADKLKLLLDTPEEDPKQQAASTSASMVQASAEEAKRLSEQTDPAHKDVEEAVSREKSRVFAAAKAPDGTIFQIDARNLADTAVKVKVRLVRAGAGKKEDVERVKSMEDAIEKHSATLGYSVDLDFVDKPGKDVFSVNVDTSGWTTSGNWVGDAAGLAHELHHLLGLTEDRYDYIESHAANPEMKIADRIHWFRAELSKVIDNNPLSIMNYGWRSPLDDDVCVVAGKLTRADIDACVKERTDARNQRIGPAVSRASGWAFKAHAMLANLGPPGPRDVEGEPTMGDLKQRRAASKARLLLGGDFASETLSDKVGDTRAEIGLSNLILSSELTPGCEKKPTLGRPLAPRILLCPAFLLLGQQEQAGALLRAAFNIHGIGAEATDAACTKPGCDDECGGGAGNAVAWSRLTQCVAEL